MRNKTLLNKKPNQRAFTLVELMVVIVILGLLAGLVGTKVIHYVARARKVTARSQIAMLHGAVKSFKLDTGKYPDPSDGLEALVIEPAGVVNWNQGGYLDGPEVPRDPWGNEYLYDCPGTWGDFDIYSYGADGKEGGEDEDADIFNTDTTMEAQDEVIE